LATGALNYANDGYVNYLHYFGREEGFSIDENESGGIVVVLTEQNYLIVICGHDVYILRYNDDRAMVTNDGYVKLPDSKRFSRPEKQFGSKFGCQPIDINTISQKNGVVMFLDRRTASLVQHTFTEGADISVILVKSFFAQWIKNDDGKGYFVGDISPNYEYHITRFNGGYINNKNAYDTENNETIVFDIRGKAWKKFAHFTPEYYAVLDGEIGALNMFTFKEGLPYAHEATPNTVHLNYYGVQCRPYIGVVANDLPKEKKIFNSTELLSMQDIWLIDFDESEMGQTGRVFEGQWDFNIGQSSAGILPDEDGDSMQGLWFKATYSTRPTYNGENFIVNLISIYFGT
jgi:hypothetical protein